MAAGGEQKRGLLCSGRGWRGALGGLPASLPLPRGSSSFPLPTLPSPDPSAFWQIGLSLTFRPISERAKPLSDLIIFHFCLIVHILLLAEESGSCLGWGREGHPVPPQPRAFGSMLHHLGVVISNPQISWRSEASFSRSGSDTILCFSGGDLHTQPGPVRGRGVRPQPSACLIVILLLLLCTQFAPGSVSSARILLPSSSVQVAPAPISSAFHAFFKRSFDFSAYLSCCKIPRPLPADGAGLGFGCASLKALPDRPNSNGKPWR